MSRRHPITALVAVTLAVYAAASAAVSPAPPDPASPRPELLDDQPPAPPSEPWLGWQGPLDDGLLGLRFGMDRYTAGHALRERGLQGRPSRANTLLFAGSVLSRAGEVLAEFRSDPQFPTGERMSRIQITWTVEGVPHGALSLFERLEAMLVSRYGEARLSEEDGFAALDSGWGKYRRGYLGPQAKALLELDSSRSERYRVVLSLESPQLHVPPPDQLD